jgi:hypothetical protein
MSKVIGIDPAGPGVYGQSENGTAVEGFSGSKSKSGVYGFNNSSGPGVHGNGSFGSGIYGSSELGAAVYGEGHVGPGVYGSSNGAEYPGVYGYSPFSQGVYGEGDLGPGVAGYSHASPGVAGYSVEDPGVKGNSSYGSGLQGHSVEGPGIEAWSEHGTALSVTGNSDAHAIHVTTEPGTSAIFAEVPPHAWGLYTIASGDGVGVYANSQNGVALHGIGDFGTGVMAESGGGIALQVIGRIQVRRTEDPLTQIVGVATLRKGDTSVVVTTPAVTAVSLVLLTPHANPGGQLWVDVKQSIFAIETSAAPTQDVPIAYLIIN